jgi:hypothetical protein
MIDLAGKGVAAHLRQAGIYRSDIRALGLGMQGDGVLRGLGCAQQGSPDMTVAVAAGMVRIGGYFAFVPAASVTITAAHATLHRMDLVVCDWNGVLSVVAGTPAPATAVSGNVIPPLIPDNSVPLAQVYVPPAATAITTALIWDRRPVLWDDYDSYSEFVGSNLSGTVATSAGSIGGELSWTMSGSTTAPTFQAVTGRPGILRAISGNTANSRVSFHYGVAANTAVFTPSNIARMVFIGRVPVITVGAFKIGLGQDLSVATAGQLGTAGAWFEFVPATSAKWQCVTRQAAASTISVDTGANVTATDWYKLEALRRQDGNWQFIINESRAYLHSANLPTTDCNAGTTATTLEAVVKNIDHDFWGLNFAPLGNRWT